MYSHFIVAVTFVLLLLSLSKFFFIGTYVSATLIRVNSMQFDLKRNKQENTIVFVFMSPIHLKTNNIEISKRSRK